ncbi:MAG: ISKra4 family transposase [Kiritimatiellae bacterium]|nr:ISKra4 family transposase [Kiritimatiellia bacterium]
MESAADSVAERGIGCTSQLEHGLNAAAQSMCRELMEALLTSEASVRDGYVREKGERHGGTHGKDVDTLFGPVGPVPRTYYYGKDAGGTKSGHYPWDERMGLLGQYTPAVVSEVLRLAAMHSYEEAAQEFENAHGWRLSPDAMRGIVLNSSDSAAKYHQLCESVRQEERTRLAYVLVDGTGISMFQKCLEGVKGKDGGPAKTREVKLAAFFTGSMKKGKPWRDDDSTTYVATTQRWEPFGKMARREFDRRFPLKPDVTVFLSDGGNWTKSVHDNDFNFAVMILDIFHALEHLREIMKLLGHREKTDEWTECFRRWKRMIKAGRIKSVVKEAEKQATAKGARCAAKVDDKLQYYRDNYDRMKYDEYILNGWFIGSGVVESGCKCVVQQRLDLSGMHWSLRGAEALLPIRALYKSGRLDEFHNWRVKDLEQVAFQVA